MEKNIIMDFERINRCGIEEAVLCAYKTPAQLEYILHLAQEKQKSLLLTRLTYDKYLMLSPKWQHHVHYQDICHCGILGQLPPLNETSPPLIAIVSAGSSDAGVSQEALLTLNYHGIAADVYQDIGVAGLWRLQQYLPVLQKYSIIIAIAGMEAALPTVLAGLIKAPIIAVPTSVGYGVSAGGTVALQSCLSSCAAGIMTMNIDNGYGAACAAIKIYHQIKIATR